jgi:hypothetical protein
MRRAVGMVFLQDLLKISISQWYFSRSFQNFLQVFVMTSLFAFVHLSEYCEAVFFDQYSKIYVHVLLRVTSSFIITAGLKLVGNIVGGLMAVEFGDYVGSVACVFRKRMMV